MKQTYADLERHFREQFEFLRTSSELYDTGTFAEAKRLAVTIRVLVHDTDKSRSLLKQLGWKNRRFLDTASERPQTGVITSYAGLAGMMAVAGGTPKHVPHLDRLSGSSRPFQDWWNAPVIIDFKQRQITRKRLILGVANQDGGAHIDPELDEIYADLSRGNSMSRMHSSGGSWEPLIGVEHASVRQIAHEVLKTLDSSYTARPSQESGIVVTGFKLGIASPSLLKVGRNEPCPCGSGKKYKKCHGDT